MILFSTCLFIIHSSKNMKTSSINLTHENSALHNSISTYKININSIENCRSRLKHRLDDTLDFVLKCMMIQIHWFLMIRTSVWCIGLEIRRTRSSRLRGTWSAEYCQDTLWSAGACSRFRFLLRRIWKYNKKRQMHVFLFLC